jgi:hypothetical protein
MTPMTVREFVFQMYRLISASNPTIPLHGDDESLAIRVLNQMLNSYASSGLMLTIAQTVSVNINTPQNQIFFTDPDYSTITTHNEIVTLTTGSPSFAVTDGTIYFIGDLVTGAGIPASSTIISIVGNIVTITNNATISMSSMLTFSHDASDPTVAYIKQGRLANLDSAWLLLNGVTYPLIDKSRDEFLAAWKYEPLIGLPRFIITFPQTAYVSAQLYPAPSQFFTFFCRGKFKLPPLTANSDLSGVPDYYILYFLYAVGKYVAQFKSRNSAWTPDLEATYRELKDNIEGASEVNLSIAGDEQSLLNGAFRVRAGI